MKLNCTYETATWSASNNAEVQKYTCKVKEAAISEPTEIEEFNGKHLNGKKNEDVEALRIGSQVVEHFPKGLFKIFPNLTALSIYECGLKQITKRDLEGFGQLEILFLLGNKITSLEEDLLINTPKLKWLSFKGNLIQKVPSKFLEPVKENLEFASFLNNQQLNTYFNIHDTKSLGDMMIQVFELKQKLDSQSKMFGEMFDSGQFSDFTIKVHGKEQKVHKNILAPQSSVFAEIFASDNEKKELKLKKVPDFGEEVFEEFLKFFYSRNLSSEDHLMELFQLAVNFDVPELKATSEEAILRNLDVKNALEIFNFGVSQASDMLKRAAFDLLKKLHPEIHDFLYEEPDLVNGIIKAKLRFAEKK